jgi:DNA processing protein
LNWDQPKVASKNIQPKLFIELHGDDKKIYDFLQKKGKETLDNVSLELKIPIYKLSSILLNLELQGLIRPLPGKSFEVI